MEQNKYVGAMSTTMRALRSKNERFSSWFDRINENNIINTSLKKNPNANHTIHQNKGKKFDQLFSEDILFFVIHLNI